MGGTAIVFGAIQPSLASEIVAIASLSPTGTPLRGGNRGRISLGQLLTVTDRAIETGNVSMAHRDGLLGADLS